MTKRALVTAAAAGILQGCTPLQALNAVSPRPIGVRTAMRDVPYGAFARQRLDVYRPQAAGPLPLLIFFYGGGWEAGSRADYAFAGRAYASEGFVAVVPDYRLTHEAPFPAFLEDCAQAVAWAQAHAADYGADASRTVLVGHSAGAYNAAMLALDKKWLQTARAGQPIAAWAGLSGPYDFLPLEPGPGLRTFGDVEDALSTQPINFADAGDPPTFLAYGDRDEVVRPANTKRLAARLTASGVRVEEQRYTGAGHPDTVLALAWPFRLRLPVLRDSTRFLHAATRRSTAGT